MPATLLLDQVNWDLLLDASGDIAVATEPYSLAQDAASAIKTFLGEVYYNTTLGIPWLQQILGKNPSLGAVKQLLVAAAETVPNVVSAQVFLTAINFRAISGQVQVTSATTGQVSAVPFSVISPQGVG